MHGVRIVTGLILMFLVWPNSAAMSQRIAPPEVVSIQTKDGVQLKLTYYRGTPPKSAKDGKQIAPVVMLHDYKDTRAVFAPLAQRLQSPPEGEADRPSFAVVTVDLRGHGDSTKQIHPNGYQVELDAARLDKAGLFAMASLDMEAVRGFLVLKNDAAELNLNKLGLVGAGMGANVAANWALQDWGAPALAIGKQGQDVKALALISPRWSYRGLTFQAPLRFRPLKQFAAWMLVYGSQEPTVAADARRILKQLERFHPRTADASQNEMGELVELKWDSRLQGGTLLTNVGTPIEDQIVRFLVENAAKTDHPWMNRLDRLP